MVARLDIRRLLRQTKLSELSVGQVMTPNPVTLEADARLSEAVRLMERRGILHIPILRNGKLAGLLTERHIRDAVPSILLVEDDEARAQALAATRVSRVWIEDPTTVTSDTPLRVAIPIMRRLRASSLPVVDAGELTGILTAGDLISLLEVALTV